jgi:host factor-I protein
MGSKNAAKLQDAMLNQLRKSKVKVSIYLLNGVRLQGKVRSFDLYTILIEDGKQQTLVYKHSITTIIPAERLDLNLASIEDDEEDDENYNI